jgi:hypothetical protein
MNESGEKMKFNFVFLITIFLFFAANGNAQDLDYENEYDMKYAGFSFTMAETGSGIGGLMAWPVFENTHFGISLGAYFLRDEDELTFYDHYYYAYPITVNKENNVYLFDFMVSLKRRFFANDLDESLRPFLTAGVGPYYGMNFPEYNRDLQGNKTVDQFAWALGGFVGAGVDVDASANFFISIRAQYRIIPFLEYIGERKNHSMFELRFEIGNRY